MRFIIMALLLSAAGWARAQNNITSLEYWFDQNGDNRTPVDITDAGYASLSTTIDVNALPYGQHTAHYRVRDTEGRWSAVLSKGFTRKAEGPYSVTAGEYWFDQDHAGHQPLDVIPGNAIDLEQDIDVSSLPRGQHRVHYRLQDNHGTWSTVLSKAFTVKEGGPYHLVQYRYWTEETDQPQDMHYVPLDPQAQFIDLNTAVAFCANTVTGIHPVYFQIQDNHGHWSSVVKPVVNVNIGEANTAPVTPTGLSGATEFEPGMTYTLTVDPPIPGASGYEWTLPSGWTGDSNTGTIEVQTPASIDPSPLFIEVVAVNDCGESSTYLYPILSTATGGFTAAGELSLFPNPTTGRSFVNNDQSRPIDRLVVLNNNGQAVLDLKPVQGARLVLDLSAQASGLYTVRAWQGDESTDLRVMVQH